MYLAGNKTIVTATGAVLYAPANPQGLIVVEMEGHKPVLTVNEVSDDNVVNLFINVAEKADFIDNHGGGPDACPDHASRYEILAVREHLADTV